MKKNVMRSTLHQGLSCLQKILQSFGHTEIRLNALEQLVSYYKELGYSPTGKTETDNVYGLLVEMQKSPSI